MPRGRKPNVKPSKPTSGTVHPPDFLSPEAREEWKRVAPTLVKRGILKPTDRAALASYCQAYARLAEAERIIERDGQIIQDPIVSRNGDIIGYRTKKHPAVQSSKDYHALMLRSAALFGMNPQDRQRVAPDSDMPSEQDDPLHAFLDRRAKRRESALTHA